MLKRQKPFGTLKIQWNFHGLGGVEAKRSDLQKIMKTKEQ